MASPVAIGRDINSNYRRPITTLSARYLAKRQRAAAWRGRAGRKRAGEHLPACAHGAAKRMASSAVRKFLGTKSLARRAGAQCWPMLRWRSRCRGMAEMA